MMELELDFYNTLQPPDSLSLQEMIECDIRTRAYDECPMIESTLANHAHLEFDGPTSPLSEDRLGALDTRLDSELLRDANNLTWFTTCHASPNGNLDFDSASGVLVNPQTGLPIAYPLDTSFDTCHLDTLTDDLSSDEKEETVVRTKTFNSVNPTMLEHLDANVLKEKLAKANGQSNGHRVLIGDRENRRNSINGVVRRPLRRDLSEDTTSSSSSSSSSEEEEINDDEDIFNTEDDYEDDEDYQEKEKSSVPTVTNSNKSTKRKCPVVSRSKVNGRPPATDGEELAPSGKIFPKPAYSYSCLIAMALKNSQTGMLPVSEIYGFMTENYPYFKTAPNGWKNSVRHNLSLNKCFEKIEKPGTGNQRKGCLWTMNPDKIGKMDEEVAKWQRKDPTVIRQSMAKPEHFELLEKGYLKLHPPPMPARTPKEKPKSKENNITKPSQKLKLEMKSEPVEDSGDSHQDNSLLDINFQNGLWGELDEKMDFDIPLASDNFPNSHADYITEDTTESVTTASTNGHAAGVTNIFNGTFLSKQLRVVAGTALK